MNYRALCVIGLAALVVPGCIRESNQNGGAGSGETAAPTKAPASAPGGGKSASDHLKIAVIPKGMTHVFWQTVKAGADAAGKEMNADVLWQGPKAETDINDQIDIVKRFAAEGVDGVALAATDKAALGPTVKDLEAKKIPVVTIDSGISPDISQSFIATDNVAAGRQAGEEMGKLLGGKGKVAVLSFKKGAATSDEREQGFLEGIKKFPGITVVEPIQYTDSAASTAQDKMSTVLSANSDLAGVFASNEPNVDGAAKVLKDKGLLGKVKLIGFDASPVEIDYLKEGVVQALIVQDPFKMGYEGVKAVAQIARGQRTPQKRIDTGAALITKENMDEPKNHKLLYPTEK